MDYEVLVLRYGFVILLQFRSEVRLRREQGFCGMASNAVLQVNMTAANYDWDTRFSYDDSNRLTGLTLEGAYLDCLNFARVKDGNVKIRLDIYNGAPYDKEIFFGIHDMRGVATEVKTEISVHVRH